MKRAGAVGPGSLQQRRNGGRASCATPAEPLVVAVGPIAVVGIPAPIPAHLGLRRSSRQSCYECSYRQDQQQALHVATSFPHGLLKCPLYYLTQYIKTQSSTAIHDANASFCAQRKFYCY